jgi:thiamine kinase-like enzyme
MGKRYIVREFRTKDSDSYKEKEIRVAKTLSDNGFGPTFLGSPVNNEFYIVEFIDRPLKYSDLTDTVLLNIGQKLRKVHNYKYTKNGRSQLDRMKKHFKKIQKSNVAVPDGFSEAVSDWIENSEEMETKTGFCHGNMNLSNIREREDGSIVFIDWVNAGNGNIYEDLGYLIQTCGLNDQQMIAFLEGYLGKKPTQSDMAVVKTFANRTCLLTAVTWFDFSESYHDKRISLKDRISKVNDILKSDDLKSFEEYPRNGNIPNVKYGNKDDVKKYAISAWRAYDGKTPGIFGKFKKWIASFL